MTHKHREGGLDVLVLNWRDLHHPRAGGAEVLTHGHARRLVERGHRLTMFVGAAEGAPPEEVVDGIRVIRRGGPVTTRAHALRWYRREARKGGHFDVVVEEVNTLPYLLGPLTGARSLLWIHQLAREVWWHEAPRALAPLGYALERSYLRLYRAAPTIVISESTRRDLIDLGFHKEGIVVVPPAIDQPPSRPAVEKEQGLLVYVGRVTPSKRIGHLVRALAAARAAGVDARLDIVGRGPLSERESLVRLARSMGVEAFVGFRGYLNGAEKHELLARASLVVMASVREGWGLVVTEANALGTPAVVYDRPGLRDSTVNEETGLVTASDPVSLAAGIVRALTEPGLYERLRSGALEWSRQFSWERSSAAFEQTLVDIACGGWKPRRH
jgi:glycosyltransferase involved in cell wall biosynthesis